MLACTSVRYRDYSTLSTRVDIVLALLRGGHTIEAEDLAGCPIQYGRPARYRPLPPYVPPPNIHPLDDKVIVQLAPNPRLPTTDAWYRYRLLKPGQTVAQAIRRGVTRRDIREAIQNNWVTLS